GGENPDRALQGARGWLEHARRAAERDRQVAMGKVRQGVSKAFKKPYRKWTILVLAVLVVGFFGFRRWQAYKARLPDGIASGNGRIESTEVDVSSKEPLKVKEI